MNRWSKTPSIERLRDLLNYEAETGEFSWRVNRRAGSRAGFPAGKLHARGYMGIWIDGVSLYSHRIAWAMTHGTWPASYIDHINGNRTDNRIVNLREATRSQNAQNRRKPVAHSKSGFLGVSWCARSRRWRAQIAVDGQNRYIGLFKTPESASAAYLAAKQQLHPFQTVAGGCAP